MAYVVSRSLAKKEPKKENELILVVNGEVVKIAFIDSPHNNIKVSVSAKETVRIYKPEKDITNDQYKALVDRLK